MTDAEITSVVAALPPVMQFPFLVDWVKTYGRPSDPFLRIIDRYTVDDGGNVHVCREVLARGQVAQVECKVSFV